MSFFSRIFQRFSTKNKASQKIQQTDIKFSTLIKNIQSNIVEANESLECVGIKYIEQFFEEEYEPKPKLQAVINHKIEAIEKLVGKTGNETVNDLLSTLKVDVKDLGTNKKSQITNLRPKMTSFVMPVFKEGVWSEKDITVPLLALSPLPIPKIKELTFTSTLQTINHQGDDVYVRLHDGNENKRKKRKSQKDNLTELKISISPEQSHTEINEVISHYEQVLRSS